MNLLLDVLHDTITRGAQWAILGSGEAWLESELLHRQANYSGALSVRRGYDEALAHRILGGADLIVVPSRFEPCGLTQLYGLAYGCVPVVRRVGGLSDTVVHASTEALQDGTATGFVFDGFDSGAFHGALHHALDLYSSPSWQQLQRHGMLQDFSWTRSAQAYRHAYDALLQHA
jgi:starch synthase